MLGLRFEDCEGLFLSFRFKECALDYSSFTGLMLKKTCFEDCSLIQADFTQADLRAASFERSNLQHAIFMRTQLADSNFSTAFNFGIDPENNYMNNARFSRDRLEGLLIKYGICIE
jgi:uncharacterized protein YjbI with pentapeptide repeats